MNDMDMHMCRFTYRDPDDEFFKKDDFLGQHLNKLLIADAGLDIGLYDSVEVDSSQVTRILTDIVYKREITDKLDISDKDVRKYWEEYGGRIHAYQILVSSKDVADSLYLILKDNPDQFPQLAIEVSEDSMTNFNGGDLGLFRATKKYKTIEETAFQLKPGEISKPVKSPYGWHLIKVTERIDFAEEDFIKDKGNYRGLCTFSKRLKLEREYSKRVKKDLNYRFFDETLQMLIDKAMALKKASANQSRELNHYITVNDFTEEEASQLLISIDMFNYTARNFVKDMNRYFRRSDFNFSLKELAKETIGEMMLARLMYIDGLKRNLKEDTAFARLYEDTKLGLVYRKMEKYYIHAPLTVTDEEIEENYEKKIKTYTDPAKVRVSEILVKTEVEAKQLLDRLQHGESFSKLVKQTIRPGFAETEGNLGYFGPNRFRQIYNQAIDLNIGEYGGPVEIDNNWAIFKITDKKPERVKPLSEVKSGIRTRLLGAKKYYNLQTWLEQRKQEVENYLDIKLIKDNLITGKLEDDS